MPKPKQGLANHEIVVVAAYMAGADATAADTEDIAVQANKLAPGRFSWRKYKEQINIDTVRKRLWDATKQEKGAYLIGSEKAGWRLTKAGFDFAQGQITSGGADQPARARASQSEKANQLRELKRMIGEEAYQKLQDGRPAEITKSELERFFRIDDYVTGKARTAKLERFRILADGHDELLTAINSLVRLLGD